MNDVLTVLPDLLEQTEKAALHAGAFIRQEFGKISTNQAQIKSLNSLVSYVDINAEKTIVEHLSPLIPDAGFITEEKTTPNSQREINWIIDPLDGTTNFLKGIPVFSVSIALTQGENVVLGVVYDVMQDWLFSARLGHGATMNNHPINISHEERFEKSVIATGFPYDRLNNDSPLFDLLQNVIERSSGIRRLGSAALDLAYVACGKIEGYYESSLNPWDMAAGILLVKEAGGMVTDFENGSAIMTTGSVVAASKPIHGILQSIISESLGEN